MGIFTKIVAKAKKKCFDFRNGFIDFVQNVIAASVCCPMCLRKLIYRMMGNRIERGCYLSPRLFLRPGKGHLYLGEKSFINYNCFFELDDNIIIGSNCNIAMNVHFVNSSHIFRTHERRAGEKVTGKIFVGDGTWIGADCLVLSGVTIGKGCIIGAGSLVLNDCEDDCLYVGRPAKLVKRLDDNNKK